MLMFAHPTLYANRTILGPCALYLPNTSELPLGAVGTSLEYHLLGAPIRGLTGEVLPALHIARIKGLSGVRGGWGHEHQTISLPAC